MFSIGKLTTDLLNSIDNVAKETLEEPKESATAVRQKKKSQNSTSLNPNEVSKLNLLRFSHAFITTLF